MHTTPPGARRGLHRAAKRGRAPLPILLALLLGLGAAACAGPRRHPRAAAEGGTAPRDEAGARRLVRDLARRHEEEPPELGPEATLDDYVRYAELRDPGLRAAFEAWRAALERVPQARSLPDPRLTWRYYVEEVETRVGPQRQSLGIAQAFPWFGELALRGDRAFEAAEVLRWRLEARRQALRAEVREAWYELYHLGQAIEIVRRNRDLVQYLEGVARSRYTVGAASHPDVIRAQVELGKVEDRLATLIDRKPALVARLNAALGRPAATPIPFPGSIETRPVALDDAEVLARIEETNPDLAAARHAIRAARVGVDLAEKDFFPEFSLGLTWVDTGDAIAPTPESGKDPLALTLGLSLPVWRERLHAAEREAEAALRGATRGYEDQVESLSARAASILFRLRDAERKIGLFGDTLIPKATESLRASETAFRAGKASFLDLVDAERLLLEFELDLARARADHEQARAELEQLVGAELPDGSGQSMKDERADGNDAEDQR